MSLALCTATMRPPNFGTVGDPDFSKAFHLHGHQPPGEIPTFTALAKTYPSVHAVYNAVDHNLGVIGSYQRLYLDTDQDIIAYLHDDVICREQDWDERVLEEFADPSVGVVGFGGALHHGASTLYKTPYRLQQLARSQYRSNVDDAETHGERFSGACDVAVVDGFAIVVRRALLDRIGGWPVLRYPPHHNYDYFICCAAHRCGYRVRLVGVRCHHLGGRTALSPDYNKWVAGSSWGSDAAMHEAGHRLIYDEFRDVLPWRCADGR